MLDQYLTFAHQLADVAGDIIRPYFGAHGTVENKSDASPVTLADRDAERAMRKLIEAHYPTHAIYGEEFGLQVTSHQSPVSSQQESSLATSDWRLETSYTWVIDPIDGTRAFIAGRKEWGTLIALCENGIPILGILDQPVTGERWVGMRGHTTTYFNSPLEGESTRPSSAAVGGQVLPIELSSRSEWQHSPHGCAKGASRSPSRGELICSTRPCPTLAQAELSTTSAAYFTPTQAARVVKLAQACRATVKDGDCYAYGLLARGLRDVVIDAGLKPYDILALVPIIEGAGGKISGWDGSTITLDNFREVIAVGDRTLLHEIASHVRI